MFQRRFFEFGSPLDLAIKVAFLIITFFFCFWSYTTGARFILQQKSLFGCQAEDDASVTTVDTGELFRERLDCRDGKYEPSLVQRQDYWVLKNYIRGEYEPRCHESITYTTHGDYTFLDNVVPLLDRWQAPLSLAIYAPGSDYEETIHRILWLRNCDDRRTLTRTFATFHIFFHEQHMPKKVYTYDADFEAQFNCSTVVESTLWEEPVNGTYKKQNGLIYPVNVARNVARDTAITYYIFPSDVELYPNPGLVEKFLEMIEKRNSTEKKNEVFVLPIFEIEKGFAVPETKDDLIDKLKKSIVIPFHKKICSNCHRIPGIDRWLNESGTPSCKMADESVTPSCKMADEMRITLTAKRTGEFHHWEPIFIGTHADPYYDERLSWEGKSDKMTQGHMLCLLDYDFHILSDGFLVHRPGIKTTAEARRPEQENKTYKLISNVISKEIELIYGRRKGCVIR